MLDGRPAQRNATGADGDETSAVASGCSHGEHHQILTATTVTHRSGQKPEKVALFKKSDASNGCRCTRQG